MMAEREALKASYLAATGLQDARREGLAGDASTRAYERLFLADGSRRIFMDQPPVESAPCPPDADSGTRRTLGYNAMARLAARSAGRIVPRKSLPGRGARRCGEMVGSSSPTPPECGRPRGRR